MRVGTKIASLMFCFLVSVQFVEAGQFRAPIRPEWDQLTLRYSPEELEYLRSLPRPEGEVTKKELSQLVKESSYAIYSTDLSGIDQTILPAYLANAQKDFAWLSYLLTGRLTGDLAPVTLWTLQLFIPDVALPSVDERNFDVYTSSLAALVVRKYAERLDAERRQIADYAIKRGEGLWQPTSPGYRGLNFGSAKTWFLAASDQYVADEPPPNPDFWEGQCVEIKREQANLNGEKVQAVFDWAGLSAIGAGSWESILNQYLEEKRLPVIPELYIRALFLSAIADSNAAAFNSKYTYWVRRPSQTDQEVTPLIVIPNHPSYPSAHSTISATAATVLTEVFPEDRERWNALAEESGMSRIWGGIHYMADHKGGLKLGRQVGWTALQQAN